MSIISVGDLSERRGASPQRLAVRLLRAVVLVVPTLLACASEEPSLPDRSAEPVQLAELALSGRPFDPALCNTAQHVPAQQRLDAALAAMRNSSAWGEAARFTFLPYPDLGVWVHEIFIKDDRITLDGSWSQRLVNLVLPGIFYFGQGDNRPAPDPNFDPGRTRAFFVIDFEKGEGYIAVNHSTLIQITSGSEGPIYFAARPVSTTWKEGESWVNAEWVSPTKFRVRYRTLEGVWGSEHLIAAVDAQFVIDVDGSVSATHDPYPTYGLYHYAPCATKPQVKYTFDQRGLGDLADDPAMPYDLKFTGVRPKLPDPPKIMAVGDSITHGNNGDYSWRYRLHEHLRLAGEAFDFVGPNKGPFTGSYAVGGWDDDHYARWGCIAEELVYPERFAQPACDPGHTIRDRVATYRPDVLLIHLGTNDLTYRSGPAAARDIMGRMIDMAREAKPDVDVVLAQIGDTGPLNDQVVAEYATLLAQLAESKSRPGSEVHTAAVHQSFRWPIDTYDQTHPSAHGELVIAKEFADVLSRHYGYGPPFAPISAPPPAPQNVKVSPGTMNRLERFTVTWDRVVNPGIWTTYKVQLRLHESFGGAVVWQSAETPDLAVTYDGPPLSRAGFYQIAVLSFDGTLHGESALVPLTVVDGLPAPQNVRVSPSSMNRNGRFSVTWDRVVNPGVWTPYKVQLRNHESFGGAVVWESAQTPDLQVTYDGPPLQRTGIYQIAVLSLDGTVTAESALVPLPVNDGPPNPQNVHVSPATIGRDGRFTVTWDRVVNPGIWTPYTVQLRLHESFGGAVVWESAETPDLAVTYDGPTLARTGVYQVAVVAHDGTNANPSALVPLTVLETSPAP